MSGRSWAFVAVLAIFAGCGHTPPARSPGRRLALSKCGACHLRPEPGEFQRDFLAQKLLVHDSRAPMTREERRALLDYLAPARTAVTAAGPRGERSGGAPP